MFEEWGSKWIWTFFFYQNYLARNFYNLRFLALFVAFAINFILLFYKVTYNSATILLFYEVTYSGATMSPPL